MAEAPATRVSLLIRLRDPQDQQAWAQFVDIYAPLIYGFFRKRGLQDADAADLTQMCLGRVAGHVGSLEINRSEGTFRGWLFTIVRNLLRNYYAGAQQRLRGSGDSEVQSLLENQLAPEQDEEWDRYYRARLFAWAAQQVRPLVKDTTWRAFWQTAVEGKPAKRTAQELGMSVAAVYMAKKRILVRLRERIEELQAEE